MTESPDRGSARTTHAERVRKAAAWLSANGIACAVLEDTEGRRNSSIRYYSGMNQDTLLFIFAEGKTILVPWDEIMAGRTAFVDEIVPYAEFTRDPACAVREILRREGLCGEGAGIAGRADAIRIEISSATPHPLYLEFVDALPGVEILCRRGGFESETARLRQIKDPVETGHLERACAIADEIAEGLFERIESGAFSTELDAAMFIETETRRSGAEGTGFDTLAAGPGRSFGIHAVPPFSNEPITGPGLSIFDFGVRYQGYSSDITMTILRGKPTAKQREMVRLVEEAYGLAVSMLSPGVECGAVARAVDAFFAEHGWAMPHSLGHGIGLDVHEGPYLRSVSAEPTILEEGMVFTVEPGLYDPEAGGVRWENDFTIRGGEAVPLTRSRIRSIP